MSFDFQAAYDELNPADDDYRFYAALAASAGVSRAVDLGCGTGTLARMLASGGVIVTGVDPDPDMLRIARTKDPDGRIDWRLGYSDAIEPGSAELAVMSGHVAQVFTADDAWLAGLRDLHRALVPGGLLAFESRNPATRKWKTWTRELTLRTVETPDGAVEFWHETVDVNLPLVSYDTLTRNLRTGQTTVTRDVLAFRDEPALRATLEQAGFDVKHVYGDWDRTAPAAGSPELIVIARRPCLDRAGWLAAGRSPAHRAVSLAHVQPGRRFSCSLSLFVGRTRCATIGASPLTRGDVMAFAMRPEWKAEPASTTGASYVEPSATDLIRPGQRVAHLFPRSVMEEYVLQRVTERVWWVSRHFYGSLFYVGTRGVLLLDPFLGGADATVKAIASVTDLPVTAVVYSHFHADHTGGARRLFELLATAPPRVIASENTAIWMERFGSDLPMPADVLEWPSGALSFEDVTLRLHGLPRPGHAPDHAVFLLEEERVGHSADLINIDQLPFGGFAGQDPLVLFKPNLEFARSLEFDWFCGGHGNIGEKSDFDFYLTYLDEVAGLVNEYAPRPEAVPDLSLTDYLGGLDEESRSRLLSGLDNHFGLYLYGRQIAAGQPPSASGGNPFLSGTIGEWAAQRDKAVDEAVPRIIEQLRPKYGRMYNFDDAQPGNVRLMALSIQPSLTNR